MQAVAKQQRHPTSAECAWMHQRAASDTSCILSIASTRVHEVQCDKNRRPRKHLGLVFWHVCRVVGPSDYLTTIYIEGVKITTQLRKRICTHTHRDTHTHTHKQTRSADARCDAHLLRQAAVENQNLKARGKSASSMQQYNAIQTNINF